MNQFFAELGQAVLARWKKEDFSPAKFPEIAKKALEARPPSKHVDIAAFISEFLLDDAQPYQTQSGFGQPEIVVYDDPRFYIQILFWLDGTTDIHQHTFSGAFHVMSGSSIHSRFAFENATPVTAHLQTGDVRMVETALLETGSTVPITSGRALIHALFHLETPSITVVVRTHNDPGTGPQFTYLPPHLAVDPFQDDALTARRKQLLDVLEYTGDPAYGELVAKMVRELDFERGMFTLQNCLGHLRSLGKWEKCLGLFRKKHGALAERVGPTFDEIVRRDAMVALRKSATEPEHRFFLALLLNVPDRGDILRMIGARFKGHPAKTAARWVDEMCALLQIERWTLDSADDTCDQDAALLRSALRAFIDAESGAVLL